MTLRQLRPQPPAAQGDDTTSSRHAARIRSLLLRAMAGGEADAVALLAEGSTEPVALVPMPGDEESATRLAEDLADAARDEGAPSCRVVVQRGDATLATLTLRARAVVSSPVDESLRRPGEPQAEALLRQLMRHQEGLMRLLVDRDVKRADAEGRREAALLDRVAQLEAQAAAQVGHRIELMRTEAQLAREMADADRRDQLERETLRLLVPAAGRLVQRFTAPAALPAPPGPTQAEPEPGTKLAAIVAKMDSAQVDALAAFLPPAEADELRAAHAALTRPRGKG